MFKVSLDPFVGSLSVFRIHQGIAAKDAQAYTGEARKAVKMAHLYRVQGKDTVEIDCGLPGDICAVTKHDEIYYDAVLHVESGASLGMRGVDLPAPMHGLVIPTKSRVDEQKMSDILHKVSSEDSMLTIEQTASTNEMVLRGVGDLHLRVVLERMPERYNVDVATSTPKIAYKETISAPQKAITGIRRKPVAPVSSARSTHGSRRLNAAMASNSKVPSLVA